MGGEYLERLDYVGFRNLADATVELAAGLTLVIGENGQGKTNLLEAAYVLGTSKSFRTAALREMVRRGAAETCLSGRIAGSTEERLGVRIELSPPVKTLARGARGVALAGYLGVLRPVAFTAETRDLVGGSPEGRRSFVDRGAATLRPGYLPELAAYRRALRQKSSLLEARGRAGEVEAWNAELAGRAASIVVERTKWIEAIKKLPSVSGRIFGEDKQVDVRYRPSPPEIGEAALAGSAADVERLLVASYGRWLGQEVRARRALVGPQRDDLEIALDGVPAGLYASAGEQRRVAFVLLMAAVELASEGRPGATILLVDDVDAEFDDLRLDRVFEYLAQAGQALVATAKAEVARRYAKLGTTLSLTGGRIVVT